MLRMISELCCSVEVLREDAVGTLKNRLQKGLDALGAAAYAVANMQSEPAPQRGRSRQWWLECF